MYKDKLKNCSCNQFHCIGTYKQVETNSMTMNRGGNNGSDKVRHLSVWMVVAPIENVKSYVMERVMVTFHENRCRKLMRTLSGYCENIVLIRDMHGLSASIWNTAGYCSV